MEPYLSIIVPCWNTARYLPDLLAALQRALLKHNDALEIIFVNDASTDNTEELLEHWRKETPHGGSTQLISNSPNLGLGRSRIAGVEHAHGPFIWFVDSDDIVPDSTIDSALSFAVAERDRPELSIGLFTKITFINDLGLTTREYDNGMAAIGELDPIDALTHILRGRIQTTLWDKVFPRSILANNLSIERFNEDIITLINVLPCADRILIVPANYCYRRHNRSLISKTSLSQRLKSIDAIDLTWQHTVRVYPGLDRLEADFRKNQAARVLWAGVAAASASETNSRQIKELIRARLRRYPQNVSALVSHDSNVQELLLFLMARHCWPAFHIVSSIHSKAGSRSNLRILLSQFSLFGRGANQIPPEPSRINSDN